MRRIGSLDEWLRFLEAGSRDDAAATLSGYSRQIDAQYADLGRIVRDLYESPTGEVADVLLMARSALAEAAGMLDSVRSADSGWGPGAGMSGATMVRSVRAEASWWTRLLWRLLRRWPGPAVVVLAAVWLTPWSPPRGLALLAVLVVVGLRVWAVFASASFHRWFHAPSRRLVWRVLLRRCWRPVAVACELGQSQTRRRDRRSGVPHDDPQRVPRLARITTDGPRVTLHLRPLLGQTVETFAAAAEQLRMAVGATRVRVDPEGVNRVAVTFTMGDWLSEPFVAEPAGSQARCGSDSVPMGRCEDGSQWRLPVGPHTLVAGMSGAGKGSVFWSFAFGLAPGVRAGTVQLHGVDLKGGMEMLMGADLFTSRATDAAEAVGLLERLVGLMRARTRAYAGRVRSHLATAEEPLHVVMVDELAALTAYCPERDLQRRAEMAINLLCSQGRAPGFRRVRVPAGPAQGGDPVAWPVHADGGAAAEGRRRRRRWCSGTRRCRRVRCATGSPGRRRGWVTWCRRTVATRCGCGRGRCRTRCCGRWRPSTRPRRRFPWCRRRRWSRHGRAAAARPPVDGSEVA